MWYAFTWYEWEKWCKKFFVFDWVKFNQTLLSKALSDYRFPRHVAIRQWWIFFFSRHVADWCWIGVKFNHSIIGSIQSNHLVRVRIVCAGIAESDRATMSMRVCVSSWFLITELREEYQKPKMCYHEKTKQQQLSAKFLIFLLFFHFHFHFRSFFEDSFYRFDSEATLTPTYMTYTPVLSFVL